VEGNPGELRRLTLRLIDLVLARPVAREPFALELRGDDPGGAQIAEASDHFDARGEAELWLQLGERPAELTLRVEVATLPPLDVPVVVHPTAAGLRIELISDHDGEELRALQALVLDGDLGCPQTPDAHLGGLRVRGDGEPPEATFDFSHAQLPAQVPLTVLGWGLCGGANHDIVGLGACRSGVLLEPGQTTQLTLHLEPRPVAVWGTYAATIEGALRAPVEAALAPTMERAGVALDGLPQMLGQGLVPGVDPAVVCGDGSAALTDEERARLMALVAEVYRRSVPRWLRSSGVHLVAPLLEGLAAAHIEATWSFSPTAGGQLAALDVWDTLHIPLEGDCDPWDPPECGDTTVTAGLLLEPVGEPEGQSAVYVATELGCPPLGFGLHEREASLGLLALVVLEELVLSRLGHGERGLEEALLLHVPCELIAEQLCGDPVACEVVCGARPRTVRTEELAAACRRHLSQTVAGIRAHMLSDATRLTLRMEGACTPAPPGDNERADMLVRGRLRGTLTLRGLHTVPWDAHFEARAVP